MPKNDELTGCKQRLVFLRELKDILAEAPEQVGCLCLVQIDKLDELIATQGIYAHEGVLAEWAPGALSVSTGDKTLPMERRHLRFLLCR